MSIGGRRSTARPELPRQWDRLERLAEEASMVVAFWKRRALESEDQVASLRRALEELAEGRELQGDVAEEVQRLRAENAALHRRMLQARKRVTALLRRLETLEAEP